jgi:3-deoxy-7-phosphoheptulonate synthase
MSSGSKASTVQRTSDLRIVDLQPVVPPRDLKAEFPLTEESAETVLAARRSVEAILAGEDSRMLAIVGPCSIHDPAAARDYAARLASLRKELEDRLFIVMRVYFEKPRTKLGWRGLILDPYLDGTYDIAEGLRRARRILLDITGMGVPAGSEMLDPIVPQYIDDLVGWASIGARTTESQTHREMASGLSMPVGFKNATDGSVDAAVNALASSMNPHRFIGIDQDGRTCILKTAGNTTSHVILRGGREGPNYEPHQVKAAVAKLEDAGIEPRLLVDCSHGNSRKDHTRQPAVLESVVSQRLMGRRSIVGFMIESNIGPGRQQIPADPAELQYGVSITDACLGWHDTERLLRKAHEDLADDAGPA